MVIEYFASGTAIPSRAIFMFLGDDTLGITYMINKSTLVEHSMLKVLEAYGGSTSDGTNIVNYDAHNGVDAARNQFWVIESTTRTTYKWNYDLVDSGGHCDWSSSSKYTDMVTEAASAWNSRLNTTIFRKDTSSTIRDVRIVDASSNPSNSQTYATTSAFNKKITFYTTPMDALPGNVVRMHTVTHELGHCLGLDESTQKGNIMKQGGLAYGTSISLDDVATYNLT